MSEATITDIRTKLEQQRLENELDREVLRSRKMRRARQLLENSTDWVTPYGDYLDRLRRDPVTTGGPASLWQRRGGRNYPVYQNETELAIFRAQARVLAETNGYVRGLRRGLTAYVLGPGLTYRAVAKPNRQAPEELVDACQAVIDEFIERTEWQGGELPSIEKEFFWRTIEDGEAILHHTVLENGFTDVRLAEPEQLTQPLGTDPREWSFGVHTHPNDVQKPLGYYLVWGETAADGEEVSPDDLTHLRRNAKRGMKRGMTDLAFDTYDLFQLASRLCAAMGDGAAQQAAIVGIREHATSTQEQIEEWVETQKDFTGSNRQGNSEANEYRYRGRWEDIAKGLSYVNGPSATNGPIYTQILQALLRSAGVPWSAPEWLISGDASNNNFASSLVAESPFVRGIEGEQGILCPTLRRTMFVVLRNRCEANRLFAAGRYWSWPDIQRYIDVQVEGKSPETRNKAEEAQTAAIEIPLGVDSRQRYTQSKGRDWEQISQDNKEYAAENAPPEQAPAPMPDPSAGPPLAESYEPEGWEMDADEYLELLESADVLEAGQKVPKKITVKTKTGTTYTKTVMVNPKTEPKKKAVKAKPEPEAKPKANPKAEAKAVAQAAVAKAIKDPKKLTAKELAGLGAHLQTLTVAELGEVKKAVGAKGGTTKADIAERISKKVAELKGEKAKTEPKPKAEPKPKKEPKPKAEPAKPETPPEPAKPKSTLDVSDKKAVQAAFAEEIKDKGLKLNDLVGGMTLDVAPKLQQIAKDINAKTGANLSVDEVRYVMFDWYYSDKPHKKGNVYAVNEPSDKLPHATRPTLTLQQELAVKNYTDEHYEPLNAALRDNKPLGPNSAKIHTHLQEAFANTKTLDKPVEVFRCMSNVSDIGAFSNTIKQGLDTGKPIQLGGYQSCSVGGPAKGFNGLIEMRIKAVHGLDAKPYSRHPEENEMLLDEKTQYKVTSYKVENGKHIVELEQIPPIHAAKASKAENEYPEPKPQPVPAPTPKPAPDPAPTPKPTPQPKLKPAPKPPEPPPAPEPPKKKKSLFGKFFGG